MPFRCKNLQHSTLDPDYTLELMYSRTGPQAGAIRYGVYWKEVRSLGAFPLRGFRLLPVSDLYDVSSVLGRMFLS